MISFIVKKLYALDSQLNLRLEPGRVFAAIVSIHPFIPGFTLFVLQVGERDDSIFSVQLVMMVVSSAVKWSINRLYK